MNKTLSEIEAEYMRLVDQCRCDLKEIKELVQKIEELKTEVHSKSKEAHKTAQLLYTDLARLNFSDTTL